MVPACIFVGLLRLKKTPIAHASSNATTQPTVISMIEPTGTVLLRSSLGAVVGPAEVLVVLLGAEVGVAARSVDPQLIWIMRARAVTGSIVVVKTVGRSPPVQPDISAGVSRVVTSGSVSKNGIMLPAESHVANIMTAEVVVSAQLVP